MSFFLSARKFESTSSVAGESKLISAGDDAMEVGCIYNQSICQPAVWVSAFEWRKRAGCIIEM